jgi:hypothetical protein
MLRWHDHDGHEHSLTIRADNLDDLLIQLRTVKAFIKAAKVCDEKPVEQGHMTTPAPQAESTDDEPDPEDDPSLSRVLRIRCRDGSRQLLILSK